jgi:hypothetical protein
MDRLDKEMIKNMAKQVEMSIEIGTGKDACVSMNLWDISSAAVFDLCHTKHETQKHQTPNTTPCPTTVDIIH